MSFHRSAPTAPAEPKATLSEVPIHTPFRLTSEYHRKLGQPHSAIAPTVADEALLHEYCPSQFYNSPLGLDGAETESRDFRMLLARSAIEPERSTYTAATCIAEAGLTLTDRRANVR